MPQLPPPVAETPAAELPEVVHAVFRMDGTGPRGFTSDTFDIGSENAWQTAIISKMFPVGVSWNAYHTIAVTDSPLGGVDIAFELDVPRDATNEKVELWKTTLTELATTRRTEFIDALSETGLVDGIQLVELTTAPSGTSSTSVAPPPYPPQLPNGGGYTFPPPMHVTGLGPEPICGQHYVDTTIAVAGYTQDTVDLAERESFRSLFYMFSQGHDCDGFGHCEQYNYRDNITLDNMLITSIANTSNANEVAISVRFSMPAPNTTMTAVGQAIMLQANQPGVNLLVNSLRYDQMPDATGTRSITTDPVVGVVDGNDCKNLANGEDPFCELYNAEIVVTVGGYTLDTFQDDERVAFRSACASFGGVIMRDIQIRNVINSVGVSNEVTVTAGLAARTQSDAMTAARDCGDAAARGDLVASMQFGFATYANDVTSTNLTAGPTDSTGTVVCDQSNGVADVYGSNPFHDSPLK